MSLVVTQEGAIALWKQLLGIAGIGYPYVRLFSSAHAPAHNDVQATYQAIELAVSGYAPYLLTAPATDWTVQSNADGAQVSYIPITWGLGAPCSIYGYWLEDQTHTFSLFAEQFPNPFVYTTGGGSFTLLLNAYLVSQPFTIGPCV